MEDLPPWLQSSTDPTQISLSIESFGKVLVGLIAVLAVAKGLDVQYATTQAQLFMGQGIIVATSGFTMYQSLMTIYGLVRKLFMRVVVTNAAHADAPAVVAPLVVPVIALPAATTAMTVPSDWDTQVVG